jgi:hypothetical protein
VISERTQEPITTEFEVRRGLDSLAPGAGNRALVYSEEEIGVNIENQVQYFNLEGVPLCRVESIPERNRTTRWE